MNIPFRLVGFLVLVGLVMSCQSNSEPPAPRTYRMGFQNSAPRYDDFDLILQSLNTWVLRADAAMITTEVPWSELLAGTKATDFVLNNYSGLVDFYRSKNLKLWVYIDPANGLNRASDANALVDAGKSIADAEMREIYQRFVVVMDSMLRPEHLGLALETNLIRHLSSPDIYQGVKTAANEAAAEVKSRGSSAVLSVSIQAEQAWGKFSSQPFQGIDQDLADFPFSKEMGISSYPYFSFSKPEDIPLDYYSKIFAGKTIPRFVSEGGWSSKTIPGPTGSDIVSSNEIQQNYIARQSQLLDEAKATALFQLTFTDIDLTSLPPDVDPTIQYFAYMGLLDVNMNAKPGLTTWDQVFKRTLAK